MQTELSLAVSHEKERIVAIDVIRGIAVLGILLMNIPGFAGNEFGVVWNDVMAGKLTLNGFIYKSAVVLFDGKMRGLFTLLFGAGLVLFIENKRQNTLAVADAYFKRMMWLLLFGLADAYLLLWQGDVLYEYALCGIFLFAFRNMRIRYLLLVSFLILSVFTYTQGRNFSDMRARGQVYKETSVLLSQGKKLSKEQEEERKIFQNTLDHLKPFSQQVIEEKKKEILEEYKTHMSGYPEIFAVHSQGVYEYHSIPFYLSVSETFATMLIGMALFKLGFFHYSLRLRTYRLLCFIGIPLGIACFVFSHISLAETKQELWKMYEWRTFSVLYVEYPGRIILAVGYAAALMLLCRLNFLKKFLSLFANVGKMALTNYIMQTILCSLWFFGFGFGHYGFYDAKHMFVFVCCIWLIQIICSNVLMHYVEMGPLEWLWRRLTYRKMKSS